MQYTQVIKHLKAHANPDNVAGMARFGINPKGTLGVSIPILRRLGKAIGTDHQLAMKLWRSSIHEARILASLVADRDRISRSLMQYWVRDFDSWDVCDQVCGNLFRHTPYAWDKAVQWSRDRREFVKRAGFVLMAGLAVKDKTAGNDAFLPFLEIIEHEAGDERNFVSKAVNWALRAIGKRNRILNRKAVAAAKRIEKQKSKAARWVARDALRELQSKAVLARLE